MSITPRETTVAAYLAKRLAGLGADHVFAVPGDYVAAFLDAVDGMQPKLLQRISAANELEVGYAADGYARYKPIAAMAVTYGVGAFSALNAVAGSYVERLPVVVINGSPSHANRRLGHDRGILFHHDTGDFRANVDVFRRVTVAAEVLASGASAPAQIDRALCAAITERRPVYIEGLKDIWNAICALPSGSIVAEQPPTDPDELTEAVNSAWSLLSTAKIGIIWAGIELRRKALESVLLDLLEASRWPYMTTLLAKSLLPENDPRFHGVYAGPASPEATRKRMEDADAVLALGTLITDDYLDLVAVGYEQMIVAFEGCVRVGARLFNNVPLKDFAEKVTERFLSATHRARRRPKPRRPAPPNPKDSAPISFEILISRLEAFLKRDPKMILLVDESDSMYVSASMRIDSAGGYVSQAAWGSIGYSLAGAIGVGIAAPGHRPVVLIGDGGFHMTCQALSNLHRQELGAIVLVVNNSIYGIEQALVDRGPFREPPTSDFKQYNELPVWDYEDLAKPLGGPGALGIAVQTVGQLDAALTTAEPRENSLTLIAVRISKVDLPGAIDRLAGDTGYPRYPSPLQSTELRADLMQAQVKRSQDRRT
jgi:indolepyruvate decarboxylase